jgi:hypothetical protein
MIKSIAILLLLLTPLAAARAEDVGDCTTTPPKAIVSLPAPLSQWGTVICTPYGYIISNHDGWIWSYPGGYAPVFVPSQMVRSNPKPIGSKSYFTQISFTEMPLADKSTQEALAALNKGLPPEPASKAYRLSATGSLGRTLSLYFFQNGSSMWGIWCDEHGSQCNSDTRFMVLDMRTGS